MNSVRLIALLLLLCPHAQAEENLNDLPADLQVPPTEDGAPNAGRRVRQTTAGWEGTAVHHTLYLPTDWTPHVSWPVIVEYPGNGGYANKLGDRSDGTVEGCMLGYGLSAGRGFLWVTLPFIEVADSAKRNTPKWWGNVAETKRYCIATVQAVCRDYGGDPRRVVLMGFSRGAIACNYIGLHDEAIASLWCGFLAHSHYEGEFKHPATDENLWRDRLRRIAGRPLFISQEQSTQKTETAIGATNIAGNFTFATLPYPNHSARWVLCDLPLRTAARSWLQRVASHRP